MGTLIVYVSLLALVVCLPLIIDLFMAYHSKNQMHRRVFDKIDLKDFPREDLQKLLKEIGKPPPGMSGLARATMALTVIAILGIAMIHILVKGGQPEGSRVVENVLSMLAGLLAAITGFYYGGRTAEKKAEEEKTEPTGGQGNSGSEKKKPGNGPRGTGKNPEGSAPNSKQ